MKMYKLGCNWGSNAPSFYNLLSKKSLVIGDNNTRYAKGDLILVSKGHEVSALAVIKSSPKSSTNFKELEKPFLEYEIDYVDRVEVYDCNFFPLTENEKFTYKLQQGIREVQKREIKEKALGILNNKLEKEKMVNLEKLLTHKKQVILQGPPGTGKTYSAKDIAELMISGEVSDDKKTQAEKLEKSDQFELIQFHPSYTYEDFVRGIVVESEDGEISYKTVAKRFGQIAGKALSNFKDSKKDDTFFSKEIWVKQKLDDFKDVVQEEIDQNGKYKINKTVSLTGVDEDAFRYKGEKWQVKNHLRMRFSDIITAFLAEVQDRNDIKNLESLSGSAKQQSSYYFKTLQKFKNNISGSPSSLSSKESPKEKNYVLIIDEINRANLPSVLGELIYALEYRGQSVNSMYKLDGGDNKITIPENLYIIGTMNTADRSVGHIDYAIRRRFAFKEMLPRPLTNLGGAFKTELFEKVSKLFVKEIKSDSLQLEASEHLSPEFAERPQDVWLGHSYFIEQEDEQGNPIDFQLRVQYEIIPILEEYMKDGILKNTNDVRKIISGLKESHN